MIDDLFFASEFWRWHRQQQSPLSSNRESLRKEALEKIVKSVNAGHLSGLDGVDSPISQRMKAHHEANEFEMNSNWICSSQTWVCPCCSRDKFEISRIGKKGQILAKSVVHHDHMGEAMQEAFHKAFENARTKVEQVDGLRLVESMGKTFAAFAEILICEDCNNADTKAKNAIGYLSYFSFSIPQIRKFIRSVSHQSHQIDFEEAKNIWLQAKPAYDLRMELIQKVAHAAATDSHWYEPHARDMLPVPVFGEALRSHDSSIQEWVNREKLVSALGPIKATAARNLSRWRTEPKKPGKPLPATYLPMLRSEESHARTWDSLQDNWQCPTCGRTKYEVVYNGEKNKVIFHTHVNSAKGKWANAGRICGHCMSTLTSLKWETASIIGRDITGTYDFISPDELSSIIQARPHSSNQILNGKAEALIATIAQRLLSTK